MAHDIMQPYYSRGESVPDEQVYECLTALRSVIADRILGVSE